MIFDTVHTQSQVSAQSISAYVSTPLSDLAEYGSSPPPPGPYAYLPFVPAAASTNPFDPGWISQGYLVTAHDKLTNHPLITQDASTFIRSVIGLRGRLGSRFTWELGLDLNRYHVGYASLGQVNTQVLNASLASGAVNPFSTAQGETPSGLIGTKTDDMVSSLASADVLVRGILASVPAGDVGFAAGASATREHLSGVPDALSVPLADGIPAWLSYQSLSPFDASRTVDSVFAELKVPLVGASQNLPGVKSLVLDMSGRHDAYTLVGHSTVPGASLEWKPGPGDLSVRASVQRSFSAPQLYDLYGPVQFGQNPPITFSNLGGGVTQGAVFNAFSGPNTSLRNAQATTWTGGVVYTSGAVKGLTIAADFFDASDKGEIGYLSVPAIVQSVELLGRASPFAQYVHEGSPIGPLVSAAGQLSTSNPSSFYVQVPLINLASQTVRGFDASVDYSTGLGAVGSLEFASHLTAYASYLVQALPNEGYY